MNKQTNHVEEIFLNFKNNLQIFLSKFKFWKHNTPYISYKDFSKKISKTTSWILIAIGIYLVQKNANLNLIETTIIFLLLSAIIWIPISIFWWVKYKMSRNS